MGLLSTVAVHHFLSFPPYYTVTSTSVVWQLLLVYITFVPMPIAAPFSLLLLYLVVNITSGVSVFQVFDKKTSFYDILSCIYKHNKKLTNLNASNIHILYN